MKYIYNIKDIFNLKIPIKLPSIIFLKWDLWAWKTTISKHILNNLLWIKEEITSPTYTYYNKYTVDSWLLATDSWQLTPDNWLTVYHFDLYRLSNYDEFFAIWWEDILDNNSWIILIEWPELIEKYYKADLEIILKKTKKDDEREIEIIWF